MCPGGGPVLGHGPGGVGQSGPAAAQNEAPGRMLEDLSGAMFCCKHHAPVTHLNTVDIITLSGCVHTLHNEKKTVRSVSASLHRTIPLCLVTRL